MANIPGSGSISFSDLQVDFGDITPSSLSEFYKAGGKVLSTVDGESINSDVPLSGKVSLSNYYGAKGYFVHTISANTSDVDLVSVLTTAGWDGKQPVYLIVNSNVYVYGYPRITTMSPGIEIENNSSNPYYITIKNNGYILGAGGTDYGNGFAPTEAINCSGSNAVHLIVKNTLRINGGGGAGKQMTRQTGSGIAQYFGGGGGGAGGGVGDQLNYFNGSSTSVSGTAYRADGVTGSTGREGDEGEGSGTHSTTGNAYPLTGGAAGGAGGGLYDGIRVGGAQGGSVANIALPTVIGTWSNYSGTINLASGGANNNAGEDGPVSSFVAGNWASGAFGAGGGGGWGADGGNGMQYLAGGSAISVHDTSIVYDGAAAIKNTSTGGSTTIDNNYSGTIHGDIE